MFSGCLVPLQISTGRSLFFLRYPHWFDRTVPKVLVDLLSIYSKLLQLPVQWVFSKMWKCFKFTCVFINKAILVYTNHVVFKRRFPTVSRRTFGSYTTFQALQTIFLVNHCGFGSSELSVFVSSHFCQAAMEGLRSVSTSILASTINKSTAFLVLFKSTTSTQNWSATLSVLRLVCTWGMKKTKQSA